MQTGCSCGRLLHREDVSLTALPGGKGSRGRSQDVSKGGDLEGRGMETCARPLMASVHQDLKALHGCRGGRLEAF